ncbi:NTF2-like protein [Hesseltinella vesiculosa]|uniref:NTF2-like protein n=1 Tax=Hesseltinella vesiculosa TaxID=101127 RepID=A0A1X2G220_9FUNG|nr:NTF2-like protein [Hesseltinella vesiculosa]
MVAPAQKEAPKSGLSALFGGFVPKRNPAADLSTATPSTDQVGGRMKTKRKNLATKARMAGRQITLAATKTILDEDADIDMNGTSSTKKKRKPRHNPYGGRKKPVAKAIKQHPVEILIQGCPPGSEMSLIQFLQIKSKKTWQPLDCKAVDQQGTLLLVVDGDLLAASIARLDGYLFGTSTIHIELKKSEEQTDAITTDQDEAKAKLTTMDVLRLFLKSRWTAESGYLNLDNMADDPLLKRHAIRPPGDKAASAVVGPAMMKLAGEMFGDTVVTLSFANNRLLNVQPISTVAQYLPQLQNLSFQHNLIKSYEGLQAISGTGKLLNLRELVLDDNPLVINEIKQRGHNRGYVRNVVKRFPTIVLLDGSPIQLSEDDVESIQKTGKIMPLDTRPNYFDSDETRSIVMNFLVNYFRCFDSGDRSPLALLYHPQAIFTITNKVRLRAINRQSRKTKKTEMDDGSKLEWNTLDHNLKLNNEKQAAKGIMTGSEVIGETLKRLPPTEHDFSNAKDYVLDAYQTPAGMVVILHGEFKQDPSLPPFSFDRSFILLPTEPGSVTASTGSPVTIVSDALNVRDYVGNQGFQVQKKYNFQSIFMPGSVAI